MDLEMFTQLRLKHPGVTVDTEVVEPSAQQLHNYKGKILFTKKKQQQRSLSIVNLSSYSHRYIVSNYFIVKSENSTHNLQTSYF